VPHKIKVIRDSDPFEIRKASNSILVVRMNSQGEKKRGQTIALFDTLNRRDLANKLTPVEDKKRRWRTVSPVCKPPNRPQLFVLKEF